MKKFFLLIFLTIGLVPFMAQDENLPAPKPIQLPKNIKFPKSASKPVPKKQTPMVDESIPERPPQESVEVSKTSGVKESKSDTKQPKKIEKEKNKNQETESMAKAKKKKKNKKKDSKPDKKEEEETEIMIAVEDIPEEPVSQESDYSNPTTSYTNAPTTKIVYNESEDPESSTSVENTKKKNKNSNKKKKAKKSKTKADKKKKPQSKEIEEFNESGEVYASESNYENIKEAPAVDTSQNNTITETETEKQAEPKKVKYSFNNNSEYKNPTPKAKPKLVNTNKELSQAEIQEMNPNVDILPKTIGDDEVNHAHIDWAMLNKYTEVSKVPGFIEDYFKENKDLNIKLEKRSKYDSEAQSKNIPDRYVNKILKSHNFYLLTYTHAYKGDHQHALVVEYKNEKVYHIYNLDLITSNPELISEEITSEIKKHRYNKAAHY